MRSKMNWAFIFLMNKLIVWTSSIWSIKNSFQLYKIRKRRENKAAWFEYDPICIEKSKYSWIFMVCLWSYKTRLCKRWFPENNKFVLLSFFIDPYSVGITRELLMFWLKFLWIWRWCVTCFLCEIDGG